MSYFPNSRAAQTSAQPKSLVHWSAIVRLGAEITVRDRTEPE